MTWLQWFQRALNKYESPAAYYAEYKAYHAPLYDAVVRACPPPSTLLEVGAGIGLSAMALAEMGYLVDALEPDDEVRDLGVTVCTQLPESQCSATFWAYSLGQATVQDDLFPPHDVVTCLGLLEHHDYPDRLVMLGQLALLAPVVVVAIPSPLQLSINPPDMGEKAIGLDELTAEVEAAGLEVVEAFGWGSVPNRMDYLSYCVVGRRASVAS